jgi:hypothetical protein
MINKKKQRKYFFKVQEQSHCQAKTKQFKVYRHQSTDSTFYVLYCSCYDNKSSLFLTKIIILIITIKSRESIV